MARYALTAQTDTDAIKNGLGACQRIAPANAQQGIATSAANANRLMQSF
jgi:hypothetical protein